MFGGMPLLRRWLPVAGWALSAIGFASFASLVWQSTLRDGGFAYDLHASPLAGRHLLDGTPLYAPMQINDFGAYRYPPTFAMLAAPFTFVPEPIVTWAYRLACVACVRYLVGSWRAVGWALLFTPVQIELVALNVTLPIAAAARAALRGSRGGVISLPATAAAKFGTALLLPYLWVVAPRSRRRLVAGAAIVVVAFGLHALLDPAAWPSYLASLTQQAGSPNDAPFVGEQLLFLVPSTLGDFLLRFGIGALLVVVAIQRRWAWLAFVAAAIAVPTLWAARLAALVGVPRLMLEARAPQPVIAEPVQETAVLAPEVA